MFNNRSVSVFLQWIFVLAIAATAAATTASAQTTYPNTFANTSTGFPNPCGSKQVPCQSIKNAIDNTDPGGTLTLTYAQSPQPDNDKACDHPYENVKITKSITIQADSGLTTKPCFKPATSGLNIEGTVKVYLKGLRFVGGAPGASIAVSVNKGAQLFVEDCYFFGINYAVTLDIGSLNISCSTFNDIATAIIIHKTLHGEAESATVTGSHFIGISTAAIRVDQNASVEVSMSDFNIKKDFVFPAGTPIKETFNSVTRYH